MTQLYFVHLIKKMRKLTVEDCMPDVPSWFWEPNARPFQQPWSSNLAEPSGWNSSAPPVNNFRVQFYTKTGFRIAHHAQMMMAWWHLDATWGETGGLQCGDGLT